MINSELGHVKTLEEFNSEIRRQQEEAHGKGYCDIHDAIKKYMEECDSYMELGTHQGGTASIAMLTNPNFVQLVDIDFTKYRKFLAPIARKYCKENDINLILKEMDSRTFPSMSTASVDMLVIDSVHKAPFMKQELTMHGANVNKYILAHDTSRLLGREDDQLFRELEAWGKRNRWVVIERGINYVGYTVLKKKGA